MSILPRLCPVLVLAVLTGGGDLSRLDHVIDQPPLLPHA
jgi:hypothetical protein